MSRLGIGMAGVVEAEKLILIGFGGGRSGDWRIYDTELPVGRVQRSASPILTALRCLLVRWMMSEIKETTWS